MMAERPEPTQRPPRLTRAVLAACRRILRRRAPGLVIVAESDLGRLESAYQALGVTLSTYAKLKGGDVRLLVQALGGPLDQAMLRRLLGAGPVVRWPCLPAGGSGIEVTES